MNDEPSGPASGAGAARSRRARRGDDPRGRARAARLRGRQGRRDDQARRDGESVRAARGRCAQKLARGARRGAGQPVSGRRRRRGEGRRCAAALGLPDDVGAGARQRLGRAAPDDHDGGGGAGRGGAGARSVLRDVPRRMRSLARICATCGGRCAPTSRSTSTRCWPRSRVSGRRSCGSRVRTIRPATCSTRPTSCGSCAPRRDWSSSTRRITRSPNGRSCRGCWSSGTSSSCARSRRSAWPGSGSGYAVGHPAWIAEIDKVRSPYNLNALTQAAAPVLLAEGELSRRPGGGDSRPNATRLVDGAGCAAGRYGVSDADQFRARARSRRRRAGSLRCATQAFW